MLVGALQFIGPGTLWAAEMRQPVLLGLSKEVSAELEDTQRFQVGDPFSQAAARIGRESATAHLAEEPKRFRGQISLGGYYDNNVTINLNPGRDLIAESFKSRETQSPGLLNSLLTEYSFDRSGPLEANATYSFFQTVNFNDPLHQFNLQNHLGGLSGFYRGTLHNAPYQLTAQYTYDYLILDQAAFLSRHTPLFSATLFPPALTLPWLETVNNLATALYRYQVKEFYREPANNHIRFGAEIRDVFASMIGVPQAFRFAQDRHVLRFGYQYDNEAADGLAFAYTENWLQLGLPLRGMSLRYDYDVHWRAYKNPPRLFLNDEGLFSARYDIEQMHLLQLVKPLADNFILTAQYQRIRNDSNISVYDYTKNAYTLIVRWGF